MLAWASKFATNATLRFTSQPSPSVILRSPTLLPHHRNVVFAGPLVLYSNANGNAIVLGPSSHFKVGVLTNQNQQQGRQGKEEEEEEEEEGEASGGIPRVVGGAHGMITSIPGGYSLSFALVACRRSTFTIEFSIITKQVAFYFRACVLFW